MKKVTLILLLITLSNCTPKNAIKGEYKAVTKSSFFEAISFDGEVATFGGIIGKYMPASNYKVKNEKIYIETVEGILVFKIVDSKTIKGTTSMLKGDIYKK